MRDPAVALLCMAVGLAVTGCADDRAWVNYRSQAILTENRRMQREYVAQRQTTDRLFAGYRACVATGALEDACWGVAAAYRECLDGGGSDAMCRVD